MSKGKNTSRKTKRIVRAPATKFAHLQKKSGKRCHRTPPKTKHAP